MNKTAPTELIGSALRALCQEVRFEPGDLLRRKGQHYRDMYLITDGCVEIDRETEDQATRFAIRRAGSPIGEIGFLRGTPALAMATAKTAAAALVIDDAALARLERQQPALAAQLLRHLAEVAEERSSCNLTLASAIKARTRGPTIDVHLCRSPDMLEGAQRLRYNVYCGELGRRSPYADDDRKVIADDLDETGHTFVAVEGGETIGTLRVNLAFEGPLGVLEELYGMRASPHHPRATGVCTKFIVRKAKRGGATSMKLISAAVRYGLRHGIKECYIDCIPALLPYYKAIGFRIAGEKFLHRENGPSHPMRLDLTRYGARLSEEGGLRANLGLLVKAQVIKLLDKLRRVARVSA